MCAWRPPTCDTAGPLRTVQPQALHPLPVASSYRRRWQVTSPLTRAHGPTVRQLGTNAPAADTVIAPTVDE